MVLQMIGDERLDEVVAVVVSRVPANVQRLAGRRARLLEEMRVELGFQELVVLALVDEDRRAPSPPIRSGPSRRARTMRRGRRRDSR